MKSKLTTYLLIIAVTAVWGVIAWKVLSPPQPDASGPAATRHVPAKDETADTLLLNYRDPFLSGHRATPATQPTGLVMRSLPPGPVAKKAVKHNVRYVGRIRRKGVEYSLAEVNGTLHTMRPGQTADDYRLDKIFPDSLYFTFDGERCCVKISQ